MRSSSQSTKGTGNALDSRCERKVDIADLADGERRVAAQQARRRRAADGSCFAGLFLDVSFPSRRRGVHSQE